MTAAPAEAASSTVEVFGIRHHGPGSARALVHALTDFDPDVVLIEGPADADPLAALVQAEGMVPPVALLAYVADEPRRSAFWPYAVFSPEWQALTWAADRGVPVRFCDLPSSATLAIREQRAAEPDEEPDAEAGAVEAEQEVRRDPLAALADAAGYDDPERWWDDVVESRLDGRSPFPALIEAMAALRETEQHAGLDAEVEAWREAHMRQTIRSALKEGHVRVAVVCGAWHAPVLTMPLPPAAPDSRLLRGLPKAKTTVTWVPWTHSRLAYASGYGAGVESPGWYHHLWTAPDRPVTRWLTYVAGSLRQRDLPVSTAHVIDAVRLAEGLATMRGRPLAGLAEVTDATRSVLCGGDETSLRYVTDHLVVGEALGSVSDAVPTVPLESDLLARTRRLRLKREALATMLDLDLRKPNDQERSRLFHRLGILGVDWATPGRSDVRGTGTFRETWQLEWRPELAVSVVEAALWGTTVESAAAARLVSLTGAATLAVLTDAVERCLLADLQSALPELLGALDARAAVDTDVVHLMQALPALVRAQRYGDVRSTDTASLGKVAAAMLLRICTALPQAVTALDDEAAVELRGLMEQVHRAVGLTDSDSGIDDARWLATLRALVDRADVNGVLVGRVVRLLHDGGHLDDTPDRLHRALSVGMSAAQKAGFVDGFFADGALLLIHDAELLRLLDDWVVELREEEFVDVLPLVRRTFSTYTSPQRRMIGERVKAGGATSRVADVAEFDRERGLRAVATVRTLLGRPT